MGLHCLFKHICPSIEIFFVVHIQILPYLVGVVGSGDGAG